jgi:hypothetical protein
MKSMFLLVKWNKNWKQEHRQISQRIGCNDDNKNESLKIRDKRISNSLKEKTILKRIYSRSSSMYASMLLHATLPNKMAK